MSTKLARLMTLMSPTFPTGSFGYSYGLEAAYSKGAISSPDGLASWIEALLHYGSIRNDLIILAEAWRAYTDPLKLVLVQDSAAAVASCQTRLDEQINLGKSFIEAVQHAYTSEVKHIPSPIALPVAVGAIAAHFEIPLEDALIAYGHNSVNGYIQAALRLAPVGQRAGVSILGQLESTLENQCTEIEDFTLDDLASSSIRADILSMHHATLESRTFLS